MIVLSLEEEARRPSWRRRREVTVDECSFILLIGRKPDLSFIF